MKGVLVPPDVRSLSYATEYGVLVIKSLWLWEIHKALVMLGTVFNIFIKITTCMQILYIAEYITY